MSDLSTLIFIIIGIIFIGLVTIILRCVRRPPTMRPHKRHRLDTWD